MRAPAVRGSAAEDGRLNFRLGCPELGGSSVRRQGLEPRTVALRELSGRSPDLRPSVRKRCVTGHSLTAGVRY